MIVWGLSLRWSFTIFSVWFQPAGKRHAGSAGVIPGILSDRSLPITATLPACDQALAKVMPSAEAANSLRFTRQTLRFSYGDLVWGYGPSGRWRAPATKLSSRTQRLARGAATEGRPYKKGWGSKCPGCFVGVALCGHPMKGSRATRVWLLHPRTRFPKFLRRN